MATSPLLNSRGQPVESFSATSAKNAFGTVLEKAIAKGMVAITRHDRPRAVVLSVEEYQALLGRVLDPLRALRSEFDGLVARMQTPKAKAAGKALFHATPAELGRAAVTGARRRG